MNEDIPQIIREQNYAYTLRCPAEVVIHLFFVIQGNGNHKPLSLGASPEGIQKCQKI